MVLKALTTTVHSGTELTSEEIIRAADSLASPSVEAAEKEAFLEALAVRGEQSGEIAAFARAFRGLAKDPGLDAWAPRAIDVCGTGGDKSGSFNISTVVGFILAADGVPVFKHGNRSITSKCGSADLLERLGIKIDADPDLLTRSMEELGFAFLFAPVFHPAFKEIVPVRKALAARGLRTIFNLLGPLLNPARPAHQIMGIFGEGFVRPAAMALHDLGLKAGYVVHCVGSDGTAYDELTVCGRNLAVGFGRLQGDDLEGHAADFGVPAGPPEHLAGGDVEENSHILDELLSGRGPAGLVDTILINAAAALHAVGRANSLQEGIEPARELLVGGPVLAWLDRARRFYQTI